MNQGPFFTLLFIVIVGLMGFMIGNSFRPLGIDINAYASNEKTYKVETVPSLSRPKEVETFMNELAKQGWKYEANTLDLFIFSK